MPRQLLQNHVKLPQVEYRLQKDCYLNGHCLPGAADTIMFRFLQSMHKIPNKSLYPCFYHWYITIKQFSPRSLDIWLEREPDVLHEDALLRNFLKIKFNDPDQVELLNEINDINSVNDINRVSAINGNGNHNEASENAVNRDTDNGSSKLLELDSNRELDDRAQIDYVMDISFKEDADLDLEGETTKNEILKYRSILPSLRVSSINEKKQSKELRVTYRINSHECEILKDRVLDWCDVKNIRVKKQNKMVSKPS